MKKSIFPDFTYREAIVDGQRHILMESFVRVKFKGVWYVQDVIEKYVIRVDHKIRTETIIKAFVQRCYETKYLLRPTKEYRKMTDSCKKSDIQIGETERLKQIKLTILESFKKQK